jgi:hypothetical protein
MRTLQVVWESAHDSGLARRRSLRALPHTTLFVSRRETFDLAGLLLRPNEVEPFVSPDIIISRISNQRLTEQSRHVGSEAAR